MVYILAASISLCLICGQSLWGSAVKSIAPIGSNLSVIELIARLLQAPKFWFGALSYGVGTLLYFLLLSKVKFFSVQTAMTALAIVLSVLISYFFFHEKINYLNGLGIVLVLVGIYLVMQK